LVFKEEGLEKTLDKYEGMVAETDSKIKFNTLNIVGYMLLREGNAVDAEQVFKRNMEQFPDNPNAYDSYAEALAANNNFQESRKYYEMAMDKNPDNMNAREVLKHI